MASLQELLSVAPGITARPDSMLSLLEIIDDPLVEADKLVPIIERDPGLTAGLLKLCNSSLYNFKRRIGSPRDALVLVGNLTFARLCFTLSLEPVLHRNLPGYDLDLDSLWQHSLGTAYGAAFLVNAMGPSRLRDRAFTAGLLHDIGKLMLEPSLAGGGITREMEVARTGHDHAEAGAALLDSWQIPYDVIAGVRWHHEPQQAGEHGRLALAVHIADRVSHFAPQLQAESQALVSWVHKTFTSSSFGLDHIEKLASTISAKHHNIMSLAVAPGF